jgi:hypothetical protein
MALEATTPIRWALLPGGSHVRGSRRLPLMRPAVGVVVGRMWAIFHLAVKVARKIGRFVTVPAGLGPVNAPMLPSDKEANTTRTGRWKNRELQPLRRYLQMSRPARRMQRVWAIVGP